MRMITVTAAAALLWLGAAGAASADDTADVAAIKGCLAAKADTPAACIGEISGPCEAQPEGQTMEGSLACVGREETAWDAILNERYKAELAASEALEAELKGNPDAELQPVVATLKKAQRAWVAYRDAECERRYNLFQSGTYRFDAHAACQRDLTAARAIDIAASQQ